MSGHLVVLWRNLGPYHIARTTAAASVFARIDVNTVAVELSRREESRDWSVQRDNVPFEIVTLDPDGLLQQGSPSFTAELIKQLDARRPKYVCVAGYDRIEMRAAMKWSKRNRALTILMSETKWDDRRRSAWRRFWAARQVRRADAALVSGSASGEYLISLGMPRELVFRHYGAVDNDFFGETAAGVVQDIDQSFQDWRPYFMACCRLINERKNLLGLLRAYQRYRLLAGGSPWDCVICGDGVDRTMIEQFIHKERIKGVLLAGFQNGRKLAEYYARASCFVHPATREAWGLVVNEAMASGLPVIVSRSCGCAYDLVKEGVNGYSVDPYDTEELAKVMLAVSQKDKSEQRQMGLASQQIISQWGVDRFATGLASAIAAAEMRRFPRRERLIGELAQAQLSERTSRVSIPSRPLQVSEAEAADVFVD